jgi:hypothetical protein
MAGGVARRLEHLGHRLQDGAGALTVVQAPFRLREGTEELLACTGQSRVASPSDHRLRVLPDGCVEIVIGPITQR